MYYFDALQKAKVPPRKPKTLYETTLVTKIFLLGAEIG